MESPDNIIIDPQDQNLPDLLVSDKNGGYEVNSNAWAYLTKKVNHVTDHARESAREGVDLVADMGLKSTEASNAAGNLIVALYGLSQSGLIASPQHPQTLPKISIVRGGEAAWIGELDERARIARWIGRNHGAIGNVITAICPDYWTDINEEGRVIFTMDGIDDGVGFIGNGVIETGLKSLNTLALRAQQPLRWLPGYARFEANPANVASMAAVIQAGNPNAKVDTVESMLEKIASSGVAFEDKTGLAPISLPEDLGLSLDNYFLIKDMLEPRSYELVRDNAGALSDVISEGRDWIMMGLLATAHDALLLEGASFTAARQMMVCLACDLADMMEKDSGREETKIFKVISQLSDSLAISSASERLKALLSSKRSELSAYLPPSIGLSIDYGGA